MTNYKRCRTMPVEEMHANILADDTGIDSVATRTKCLRFNVLTEDVVSWLKCLPYISLLIAINRNHIFVVYCINTRSKNRVFDRAPNFIRILDSKWLSKINFANLFARLVRNHSNLSAHDIACSTPRVTIFIR